MILHLLRVIDVAYDPNAAGQFPVMAHYSPYPGWPAASVYPSVLQQQMAAVAASVSSQQTSSSSPSTNQVFDEFYCGMIFTQD